MTTSSRIQDDGCLSSDLQNAKACSQVSCRRVAKHCSNLLDAVLIFKSWFIQKQSDLISNFPEINRVNGDNAVLPYSSVAGGQRSVVRGQMDQYSPNVERDWAIRRARRAESQLTSLRNSTPGVRSQIEVGLRYKMEMERLRKEVTMCKDTMSHYQSIIGEGNRLQDYLKDELARVRKEASVLRARIASSSVKHPFTSSPIVNTPQTSHHTAYDNADTTATTMMALASFSETNQPSQDTIIHLRREIERRTRLSESLETEVKDLRETLRVILEKEVAQSRLIDSIRTEFQTLCEPVWRILQKDYNLSQLKSLNSVLNIQRMTQLAKLLSMSVPDHVIMELSQFTKCESTPDKCKQSNRRSLKSMRDSTSKRSKRGVNGVSNETSPSCIASKSPTVETDDWKSLVVNNSLSTNSVFGVKEPITNRHQVDLDYDCDMTDPKSRTNESCNDANKVEVMSVFSTSESEASRSHCNSLKFPDISSDDDDINDNGHNDESIAVCDKSISKDSNNKMIKSPLHEVNCTTVASDACITPEDESRSLHNGHKNASDSMSIPIPISQSDINTTSNLQSKSVDSTPEGSQQCLQISETSPVMNNPEGSKGLTKVVDVPDICDKITKTPDLCSSKLSEIAHKITTRNIPLENTQILDSPCSPSPSSCDDQNSSNVVINSFGESLCSDLKQSISNEKKDSQKSIKHPKKQIKKLENQRSKINLSLDDDVPSRKLTCPSLYTHGSQSSKSDTKLFSLITDKYPSSVLQWCDRLSSPSFLHEILNIVTTHLLPPPTRSSDSSVLCNPLVEDISTPEKHTTPKKKKRSSRSTNTTRVI